MCSAPPAPRANARLRVRLRGLTLVLCVAAACSQGETAFRSQRIVEKLGRVPPGYHGHLDLALDPLERPSRLARVATTCGCLRATLMQGGDPVTEGDLVPAGVPLRMSADFVPKKSRGPDTIHASFRAEGDTATTVRQVDVSYEVDPKASLISDRRDLEVRLELPSSTTLHRVRLRRLLPEGSLDALRPRTDLAIRIVGQESSSDGPALVVDLSGVATTGTHRLAIELPCDDRGTQRVELVVRAHSPNRIDPAHVVARLPVHGGLRYPLRHSGPGWRLTPELVEDITWEPGDDGRRDGAPVVTARLVPGGKGANATIELQFEAGSARGLFKGRLLLAPNAEATYRVAIPYTVAVIGGT